MPEDEHGATSSISGRLAHNFGGWMRYFPAVAGMFGKVTKIHIFSWKTHENPLIFIEMFMTFPDFPATAGKYLIHPRSSVRASSAAQWELPESAERPPAHGAGRAAVRQVPADLRVRAHRDEERDLGPRVAADALAASWLSVVQSWSICASP